MGVTVCGLPPFAAGFAVALDVLDESCFGASFTLEAGAVALGTGFVSIFLEAVAAFELAGLEFAAGFMADLASAFGFDSLAAGFAAAAGLAAGPLAGAALAEGFAGAGLAATGLTGTLFEPADLVG